MKTANQVIKPSSPLDSTTVGVLTKTPKADTPSVPPTTDVGSIIENMLKEYNIDPSVLLARFGEEDINLNLTASVGKIKMSFSMTTTDGTAVSGIIPTKKPWFAV